MAQQYFSDQVEHALAAKVRMIAGRHDIFATDVYGDDTGDANRTYTWLEAWRDKSDNQWYLDQYTRMPGVMGEAVHKKKLSLIGICFFDALHHCSIFHQAEEEKGRILCPASDGNPALVNYRDAAEAANQVINQDGIAQPCADGRILTDGFFSREAIAVAAASGSKEAASSAVALVPQRNLVSVLLHDMGGAPEGNNDNLPAAQHAVHKRDLVNAFKKAADAGERVMRGLSRMTTSKFYSIFNINQGYSAPAATVLLSVATLGALPALGYAASLPRFTPTKYFEGLLKEFRKSCNVLPDCPEKTLLLDFATAAHTTFYLERAACHYERCIEKRKSGDKVRLGLPDIERSAKAAGMNDADTQALKTRYLRGEIVFNEYTPKVVDAWDPYVGPFELDRPWDDIYKAGQEIVEKESRVTFSLLYEALNKPDIDTTFGVARRWPLSTPEGPIIRLRLSEKIQAIEANLG